MSQMYPDPSSDPTYPPPAGPYPPPQYPQDQYPQVQPQYPQVPPPGYGYGPYPPNPYGYRQPGPGDGRPGQVIGSSVLAYVLGTILIVSGVLLLFGASSIHSLGSEFNRDTSGVTAELVFDGFANLAAAGLLIAGGVSLTARNQLGRVLLVVGAGITLVECVYWILRSSADGGVLVFVLVYGALAIIALCLALAAPVGAWLRAAPPPYGTYR